MLNCTKWFNRFRPHRGVRAFLADLYERNVKKKVDITASMRKGAAFSEIQSWKTRLILFCLYAANLKSQIQKQKIR
jgi:hypothetical protein